jgi:hypothetical protein
MAPRANFTNLNPVFHVTLTVTKVHVLRPIEALTLITYTLNPYDFRRPLCSSSGTVTDTASDVVGNRTLVLHLELSHVITNLYCHTLCTETSAAIYMNSYYRWRKCSLVSMLILMSTDLLWKMLMSLSNMPIPSKWTQTT